MTIAIGTVSTGTSDYVTSCTVSHTVAAGSNRMLLVAMYGGVPASNTVLYGGVSLTLIVAYGGVSFWRLMAPTVGTANLVASYSAQTTWGITAINLTDVAQSTPVTAMQGASGSYGTNVTRSIVVAPGGVAIDCLNIASSITPVTPLTGQTQRAALVPGGGQAVYVSTQPDATQMGWTHAQSLNYAHGVIAVDTATPPVAPTLTSPTGTSTGATTASGSVSTNVGSGTLYRLASINATETAATVKAAALTQVVTASGVQTVTFSGLTGSTTYYAHYVHTDVGLDSARVSSTSFTTNVAPATALTVNGPSAGLVNTASGTITIGANGSLSSNHNLSASDGAGGTITFGATVINGSTATVTATYTPSSAGSKTVTFSDANGLTTATLSYTASLVAGRLLLTSAATDKFRNNVGTLLSSASVTFHVHHATNGSLVAQINGATDASGLAGTLTNGAMTISTLYRIDYKFASGEYGVTYRTSEAT